jgi:UDP:flavonoid glycosyltransferase YjiC (YdhE family)
LYPYLALAKELRDLGHQPLLASSETYRSKAEAQGAEFFPIRPDISLDNSEMMRYLFHQRFGTERVLREVSSRVRETYEDTLEAVQGAHVIVSHPITFASPLIAEKLRIPWISSVLAPMSFVSAYDPPVPAPFPALVRLRVFGPAVMRAVFGLGKRASLAWIKPVIDLRRELGLAPGENPMFEGAQSPDLMLAMFSRAFAEPQLDWPANTAVTGFPFYDSEEALAPELDRFIAAGPPPVVFTLGSSAVGAAGRFYADSLEAVQRLNVRAVFLTGTHAQDLPDRLPPTVLEWPYAPHAAVFARASAIVHQGGIGTTAQALRSAHPSLVVPFAHDQFDNADRVRRLGAGLWLSRGKYNARTAESAILRLLTESTFAASARRIAEVIGGENGARAAAEAIHTYVAAKGIE